MKRLNCGDSAWRGLIGIKNEYYRRHILSDGFISKLLCRIKQWDLAISYYLWFCHVSRVVLHQTSAGLQQSGVFSNFKSVSCEFGDLFCFVQHSFFSWSFVWLSALTRLFTSQHSSAHSYSYRPAPQSLLNTTETLTPSSPIPLKPLSGITLAWSAKI